jgi:transcriptional regulator with XRE-family HTH domain
MGAETVDSEERRERAEAKRRKAEALALRLRRLRERGRLSQAELARRAGVARQLVWGLEQALRPRPAVATLDKLAEALGVTTAQLRGHEPVPGLEAPPGPPAWPAPAAGDYVTSLGLLPALPPGTTVIQRRNPDGSTEVYLHIPSPCEPDGGDNRDATGDR